MSLTRSVLTLAIVATGAFVGASAASAQQVPVVSVRLPAYDDPVVLDTMQAQRHHEDATRAAVLFAARAVLEDLGVPAAFSDAPRGLLGNAQLVATRRLGRYRLSQIVDCGTNLNGPIADQSRVRMAVMVIVDSLGPSESEYRVALAAGSQSLEGATRPPLACSTTGILEENIAKLLSKKIWGS